QLAWAELLARRSLLHLLAVLVGAGQEQHVVAIEPHETGNRVGRDRLIGVADMRRAIRVGDGRGHVIGRLLGHHCWSKRATVEGPESLKSRAFRCEDAASRLCPGHDKRVDRYQPRAASASQPKTLNTKGFRSRLYSSTSRAAVLTFSQAAARR